MLARQGFAKGIGLVAIGALFLGLAQLSAHARNCLALEPASETRALESHHISDGVLAGYSGEETKDEDYFLPNEKVVSAGNPHIEWSLELFLGSALNIATPLSIHQNGEERISLCAKYHENPFRGSPYYAWRFARWNEKRAWEVELVHHKLYLANRPPEVQQFEISHGYNLITLNRAWKKTNGVTIRVGAGIVLTHPETIIRGKKLPWGERLDSFYLSGLTVQAAIAKKFPINGGLFATAEGKFTASHAHIPIQDGSASAPNLAFHGLLGFGFEF